MCNTTDDLRTFSEWKIHLKMKINFTSLKESDEKQLMHSKSDSIEIMIDNSTDETINDLFHSRLQTYGVGLEKSMKCCDFVIDYVDRLHYKFNKISLNCGI